MSETPPAPAGWYPDATNGNRMRYWDGASWTEHFAAPVVPAAELRAPEGTDPNTPWIWLFLFLPFLGTIPVFFIDWGSLVDVSGSAEDIMRRQFSLFVSPAYIATILLGMIGYGGSVVAAYLDWRELTRRQVPKPFHWAFAFLSYWVYSIGRGVVTQRRTGRGIAITWISVGLIVFNFLLAIILSVVMVGAVFGQISELATMA